MATDKYLSNHKILIGNVAHYDENTITDKSLIIQAVGDIVLAPEQNILITGESLDLEVNNTGRIRSENVLTLASGSEVSIESGGNVLITSSSSGGIQIVPNPSEDIASGSIMRTSDDLGNVYWDEDVSFTYQGTFKRFGPDMLLPQQYYTGFGTNLDFQKVSIAGGASSHLKVLRSATYHMPLETLPFGAQITEYGIWGRIQQNSTDFNGWIEVSLIKASALEGKSTIISSTRYDEDIFYSAPQAIFLRVQDTEGVTSSDEVRDSDFAQYFINVQFSIGTGATQAEFLFTSIWADWKVDKLNNSEGF